MNIDICKKHLVGKPVAFTAQDLTRIYRGVVADVIEDMNWHGGSIILIPADQSSFHHVRSFALAGDIISSFKPDATTTSESMCDEPIIDGAIPLGELMRRVILPEEEALNHPPEPPSVAKLIAETGTFTGCAELTDKFVKSGLICKKGRTLHVDFGISDQPGCMCGFAHRVEQIESVTTDLKKVFDADEIVYQHTTKTADMIAIVEVEPGTQGLIRNLPGAYEDDPGCGTYPVIKGLGMRWEPLAQK